MHKFDVIVVGGGPSGACAAIAAARNGARTLLVERYGFLGGMGTAALVGPWMTFHDEAGNQVIQGIGEEIVQRLKDLGGSPGHVRDTTGYVHTVTPFDPELAKMVYLDLCLESGVELLLHTWSPQPSWRVGPSRACRYGTKEDSNHFTPMWSSMPQGMVMWPLSLGRSSRWGEPPMG